jgi:Bacterial mobilisation protein (MobC)
MARPKKSPALIRNNLLPVRLSDVELEMFRSRSEEQGISISELMRRNGLMRPIPKRLSRITAQTYRELGRIGTNINQMTKAVNTSLRTGEEMKIELGQLLTLADAIAQCQRELIFGLPSEEDDLLDEDNEDDYQENEIDDSEN